MSTHTAAAEAPADSDNYPTPTVADVLRDLIDACSQLRKASAALAASRAANTVAIARLVDVERQANALLAVMPTPPSEGVPL